MLNIVGVMFAVESEGFQAMTTLSQNPQLNGTTVYQAALVKREFGELKVCDKFNSGIRAADDTVTGGLVGGLIGVLGGPLGVLLGGAAGALVGDSVAAGETVDAATLIEQAAEKLDEGEMALVALVEEENEEVLDHQMVKYNAVVIRYDAEVIAKEVEEAKKMAEEFERQARIALRAARKEERKERREAAREKAKAQGAAVKDVLNTELW